jgi:SAM-dependent methyltransferase
MEAKIRSIPVVGNAAADAFWRTVALLRHPGAFPGSRAYWRERYAEGGHSGAGSRGRLAEFKAETLNRFVRRQRIRSVIEFGCGDGQQLERARYPRYSGIDVSPDALARCRERFRHDPSKQFLLAGDYDGETAELALSLDVIYHLVEDAEFERYMHRLFGAAERFVILYTSDTDDNRGYEGTHIRHRKVTDWVRRNVGGWSLAERIANRYPYRGNPRTGSFADFFIYRRATAGSA